MTIFNNVNTHIMAEARVLVEVTFSVHAVLVRAAESRIEKKRKRRKEEERAAQESKVIRSEGRAKGAEDGRKQKGWKKQTTPR